MTAIILPEGALDDECEACESFCWLMDAQLSRAAIWSPDAAGDAQNLYQALRYAGSVNNGGHAQFVAHSDNRSCIFHSALAGLNLIGASPFAGLLAELIGFAASRPEKNRPVA